MELPETVAWTDSGSRRNSVWIDHLAAKTYRSIRFHISPDAVTNAADVTKFSASHPLNPNSTAFTGVGRAASSSWPWRDSSATETPNPRATAHHLARDPIAAALGEKLFRNNGLSGDDPGRAKVTGSPADHGKFSTPSLRNIAPTEAYMHDDRYKLIRFNTGSHAFDDLLSDPSETTNGIASMSASHQVFYHRLRFNLGRYTTAAAVSPLGHAVGTNGFILTASKKCFHSVLTE